MTFKMMKKPEKPVRKKINCRLNLHDGMSLKEIIVSYKIPQNAIFDSDFYSDGTCSFIYEELESEKEFEKRLAIYHSKKKIYDEWRKKNKKQISDYKIKMEEEIQKTLNEVIEKRKLELEKELKDIRKQLKYDV